jgi:hypothetical protein
MILLLVTNEILLSEAANYFIPQLRKSGSFELFLLWQNLQNPKPTTGKNITNHKQSKIIINHKIASCRRFVPSAGTRFALKAPGNELKRDRSIPNVRIWTHT